MYGQSDPARQPERMSVYIQMGFNHPSRRYLCRAQYTTLGVQLLDKHVWTRDSVLPEVSSHLTPKTQGQQRTTLEKRNLSNTYLCLSQSSDS